MCTGVMFTNERFLWREGLVVNLFYTILLLLHVQLLTVSLILGEILNLIELFLNFY